ncbi:MAG: hypothetical protein ACHQ50_07345 [Fimbriimonadales bacterium]
MLPLIVIAVAPVREPMIAFVARIYYPPGDRRISHDEVYVSDLHGRHIRRVTHGAKDPVFLQWDGRSRLVWVEQTTEELAGEAKCHVKFCEASVRRGGRRIVARVDGFLHYPQAGRRRGTPFFVFSESDYSVRSGSLRKVPKDRVGALANAWTEDDDWVFSTGKRLRESEDDRSQTLREGSVTRRLVFRESALPYDFLPFVHPVSNVGSAYCLRASFQGELHSETDYIYSLDWPTGKLTKVEGGLGDIDFDPDSPFYAGTDPGTRGLFPYGRDRTVWGAKLYAGNWKTGKRWLVLGGTVYVTSVAIQPQ